MNFVGPLTSIIARFDCSNITNCKKDWTSFESRGASVTTLQIRGCVIVWVDQNRFLGAPMHLYIGLGPSVAWSVDRLVGWSVMQTFDDPYGAPIGLLDLD